MNVGRMTGSVAEMLDDDVDAADDEQQLDGDGQGEAADGAAASPPRRTWIGNRRRRVLQGETPLDGRIPRLPFRWAEERALHRVERENELGDDTSRERATGHGTLPSLPVFHCLGRGSNPEGMGRRLISESERGRAEKEPGRFLDLHDVAATEVTMARRAQAAARCSRPAGGA